MSAVPVQVLQPVLQSSQIDPTKYFKASHLVHSVEVGPLHSVQGDTQVPHSLPVSVKPKLHLQ